MLPDIQTEKHTHTKKNFKHIHNQLPMLFRPGFNSTNEKNMHTNYVYTASTFLKVVFTQSQSLQISNGKHRQTNEIERMRCASEVLRTNVYEASEEKKKEKTLTTSVKLLQLEGSNEGYKLLHGNFNKSILKIS